jgi:hypothetical protein
VQARRSARRWRAATKKPQPEEERQKTRPKSSRSVELLRRRRPGRSLARAEGDLNDSARLLTDRSTTAPAPADSVSEF